MQMVCYHAPVLGTWLGNPLSKPDRPLQPYFTRALQAIVWGFQGKPTGHHLDSQVAAFCSVAVAGFGGKVDGKRDRTLAIQAPVSHLKTNPHLQDSSAILVSMFR